MHRLLHCAQFEHVRNDHTQAIDIITAHTHLAWLPLPTEHPHQVIYNRLQLGRVGPFLNPQYEPTDPRITIFTDGTCDRPKEQNCCKAAWAAIRQICLNSVDPSLNDFEVLQGSHVKGMQTINRGELEAVVWATEFYSQQIPRPLVDIYTDSSFVVHIMVQMVSQFQPALQRYNLAHVDLVQRLRLAWDTHSFQIHKVKSHRSYSEALDAQDLYTIMGNTLADETAKVINRQDIPTFKEAADNISLHSMRQMEALLCVYRYLCTLNQLQSTLRIEKEKSENEALQAQGHDEISYLKATFSEWKVEGPLWTFSEDLPEVVAQACPAGSQIAKCVWHFFRALQWRHPDIPLPPSDHGITWYELVVYFTLYAGLTMPIWLKVYENQPAKPFDFASSEVALQKSEVRSLWHQATNFRNVVQYLESTARTKLYPRFKKSGASSLVRLGFHRSLVGGVASRPQLPQSALAIQLLDQYATQPGQPYPLNVRLPFTPDLTCAIYGRDLPPDIPFAHRHNLYQRVKKCIRMHKPLDTICLDS